MTERVKRLLDSMRLGEHEGVVVYDPSNMFYLSGYTGEGLVLVAARDFRHHHGFPIHRAGAGAGSRL